MKSSSAVCAYGADILQRGISAFRKEIHGVLHLHDIEYVHRLRVAARRLDTAVLVFKECYPEKRITGWQKDLNKITNTLGKTRDLDIQIVCVKTFLKSINVQEKRPGVRRLLLRVMQKRKRIQKQLLKALEILDQRQTLVSLDVRSRAKQAPDPLHPDHEMDEIKTFAGQTIQPVLEKLLSYDPFVDQVEAVEELHAMRIAAKKLRYTLECFSAIYPGQLSEYLSIMRMIQDHLGTIHDCDVWESKRNQFIEREHQLTVKYFGSDRAMKRLIPGLLAFFADRTEQRENTYSDFTKYWHELHQAGIWSKLRSQVGLSGARRSQGREKRPA